MTVRWRLVWSAMACQVACSSAPVAGSGPGENDPGHGSAVRSDAGYTVDELRIAAVQHAVNSTAKQRHRCWELAAADDFKLHGQIVLSVVFGIDSLVDEVTAIVDEPKDAVLTECVAALYKQFKWPAVFADGITIHLPLTFYVPRGQYTVSLGDIDRAAPGRNFVASDGKLKGTVVLDAANTGNPVAAMTALEIHGGRTIALHTHRAAELLYVGKGTGVVFGQRGPRAGTKVRAGSAVFVAPGVPHGFVHTGSDPAKLLQLYVPAGPEGRFLGREDPGTLAVSPKARARGPGPVVVHRDAVAPLSILGGKGTVRILLEGARTGDKSAYLGEIELAAGGHVPRHRHRHATELLMIVEGSGVLRVSETEFPVGPGSAIQVPANLEHSFDVTSAGPVRAVQFYSPAGPEQRFRGTP